MEPLGALLYTILPLIDVVYGCDGMPRNTGYAGTNLKAMCMSHLIRCYGALIQPAHVVCASYISSRHAKKHFNKLDSFHIKGGHNR